MTSPYRPMPDGNTAALRRYTMQDREDVLAAGEERCSHCGERREEGDLYRLGGDGDWMCEACIVGSNELHRLMRRMLTRMAGALSVSTHPMMRDMAKEAEELLERSR